MYQRELTTWAREAYIKAFNSARRSYFGAAVGIEGETIVVGAPGEASCEAISVEPGSGETGSGDAGSGDAGSGDAGSGERGSGERGSGERGSGEASSGEADSGESGVGEADAIGEVIDEAISECIGSGAIYIYERGSEAWGLSAHVKSPETGVQDHFGAAIAIMGDMLAVGAPGESACPDSRSSVLSERSHCSEIGAVYLYERDGAAWRLVVHLTAPGATQSRSRFGAAVAIHTGVLAVGAPGDGSCAAASSTSEPARESEGASAACPESGAVFAFEGARGDWHLASKLKAPTVRSFDLFGATLSVSGNSLAIGAPGDVDCSSSGSVIEELIPSPTTPECVLGCTAAVAFFLGDESRCNDLLGCDLSSCPEDLREGRAEWVARGCVDPIDIESTGGAEKRDQNCWGVMAERGVQCEAGALREEWDWHQPSQGWTGSRDSNVQLSEAELDAYLQGECCLGPATWQECYDCRYCFGCFFHGTCELPVEEKCWGQGEYTPCAVMHIQCTWFDYSEAGDSNVGGDSDRLPSPSPPSPPPPPSPACTATYGQCGGGGANGGLTHCCNGEDSCFAKTSVFAQCRPSCPAPDEVSDGL